MTYKINGKRVTLEEFQKHCLGTPIKPGDKLFAGKTFSEFVSPIDGSVIAGHDQLREHEKKYGVKQVGDDLLNKGHDGKTRQESINHQKGLKNE